ncbi:MAG: tyrosine-type recombinase/integrase [Proteobacteria bacterium]|nr:tyrosine-type recombinase/integrase [Pseudomonadota bacterium]
MRAISPAKVPSTANPAPGPGGAPTAYKTETHYDAQGRVPEFIYPDEDRCAYAYKPRNRVERILIGRFPDTNVAKARKRAGEINSLLDAGENPNEIRRHARGELTLEQLFILYLDQHAKVYNRRPDKAEYNFRTYLKPLASRKLSEVTPEIIRQNPLRLARKRGKRTANIALTLLRTLFNRAYEWGHWLNENPTRGIRKYREQSRDRYLLPKEMGRFLETLREEPDATIRDFFLILLLTGVRKGNALSMQWQDVDLETGVWRIPDTKTGDPQTLPLAPQAIAVLQVRSSNDNGPWVFPGTGKSGHLVEPKKAWRKILDRAGIEGLWIHDLRRTHGSWMAATGANLSVISRALGHKHLATTSIYARLGLDPIRHAIEVATTAMLSDARSEETSGPGV